MFHFKTNPKWWLNLIQFLPAFLLLYFCEGKKRKKNHFGSVSVFWFLTDYIFERSFWAKKSPRWRCNTCSDSLKQLITTRHFLCSYGGHLHLDWYFWQIHVKMGDFNSLYQGQNQKYLLSSWNIPLCSVCCKWPSLDTPAPKEGPWKWKWALDSPKEPDWTPREQISSFLSYLFPIWLYLFISDQQISWDESLHALKMHWELCKCLKAVSHVCSAFQEESWTNSHKPTQLKRGRDFQAMLQKKKTSSPK